MQLNLSIFEKDCNIANCRFEGMAWMRTMRFLQQADFRKATFEKKMNIKHTRFHGPAIFTDSSFQMRAGFNRIESLNKMEFDRSNFEGDFVSIASKFNILSFSSCYCEGQLLIPSSKIHKCYFNKM